MCPKYKFESHWPIWSFMYGSNYLSLKYTMRTWKGLEPSKEIKLDRKKKWGNKESWEIVEGKK